MIKKHQTADQVDEIEQSPTCFQMTAHYKFTCNNAYFAIICIVPILRGLIPAQQNN
jgi:hypothetical protein